MGKLTKIAAGVALSFGLAAPAVQADEGLFVPNLSYRTGPFAATGIPLMNGQRDYIEMLNERDGGINGVRIIYDECETGYSTEKGVECYEKTKGEAIITQPWSTGITLQVLPKAPVDKIPLLAPGYGFSPMADGKVFGWAFNAPASYWDAANMMLQGASNGDLDSLKGKKIALLHLDHPYGKEPIPVLQAMADAHGFELVLIPVGLKEMQNQSAQWLQIRRERPDLVLMWGWGAMNAGALNEAVKTRFPMEKFIGVWWSGHDGDLLPLGDKAKGYRSISWSAPKADSQAMQDIKRYVLDAGKTDTPADQFNWVFYQRGVIISAILVEGIKEAQEHFDTAHVNAEQLRWGLENIDFSEARLAELGLEDMLPPFKTSCSDHTGHSGGWMMEWDGAQFVKASDHLMADRGLIGPLEQQKAMEYAEANAPWAMNDACK